MNYQDLITKYKSYSVLVYTVTLRVMRHPQNRQLQYVNGKIRYEI